MDLEATVVKRLQKLREWQLEQQERLLKQQQIQRDMLNQRQDCIYKALELSMQELDFNDDIVDINNSVENNVNDEANKEHFVESQLSNAYTHVLDNRKHCVKQNTHNFGNISSEQQEQRRDNDVINLENDIKKQIKNGTIFNTETEMKSVLVCQPEQKRVEQFMIDGVAPLPCDTKLINNTCIDDIPIPSPKKDFHTLLEERLRDCGIQSAEKFGTGSRNIIKKPFLRKGEGLSRFNLNQRSHVTTPKTRLRSASFTTNTQSESKYSKNEHKASKAVKASKNIPLMKSVAQKQLNLKNVALPKKKLRSKSESNTSINIHREKYVDEIKNAPELNTSDFQSGTQKELEEVRIFELLEEKAENSSFCSTSSAVLAFLQQSTPFKMKNCIYKTENGMLSIKKDTSRTKTPKEGPSLKFKQPHIYTSTNKNLPYSIDKKIINDNQCKSTIIVQDAHEMSTTKLHENKSTLLENENHDEQNMYHIPNIENDSEVDVSLHVRFSEYNEYKTIGLTDTSSISTDSIMATNFSDEKAWSDSSTVDTSNIETLSTPFEIPQISITNDEVQTMKHVADSTQCDMPGKLNYKAQNYKNKWHNEDINYDTEVHQVHYKDESEFSDIAYESSDDQNIAHSCSQNNLVLQDNGNSSDSNISRTTMQKSDINMKGSHHVNSCDDEVTKKGLQHINSIDTSNDTVFKSELLRNRLLELEQEIAIFRKENSALSLQRKKIQDDYKNLYKEYSEKEKKLEESKKQGEDRLQEERKKLAREKAALENRMRDSQEKAQQSKLERQEMQILRQEVEKLRDEMHTKETRWNAAQSRHKCQVRILKMENSKLKQEIERLQNLRKDNIRNKGKFGHSSNTKAIHQINKQIKMQCKEPQKMNDLQITDDDEQLGPLLKKRISINDNHDMQEKKEYSYSVNRNVVNEKLQKPQTTAADIAKKRNLYENLLKEATLDLTDVHEQSIKTQGDFSEPRSSIKNKLESKTNTMKNKYQQLYEESDIHREHSNINDNGELHMEKDYLHYISSMKVNPETKEKNETTVEQEEMSKVHLETSSSFNQSQTTVDNPSVKQIQHTDGSVEYRFPNGNIKKIFPDQGLTRLMYYNGDVRETNRDGKIKYFYASTRTWHTTMPDGLEILEFADGQVEKRSNNGTVEVSFPDGSIRILESDGIEKWSLPDGTLIQILTNGEKILTLPNGQREIHTKTHKRREYPDGTIKLIYLDGTQETRYSNGRIRRKDKDGNLLVDSYQ